MNQKLGEKGFKYGIEHEVAMVNPEGKFSDFTNTSFEQLNQIIDLLPVYKSDYPGLRVGDLGIKSKRWYIEGYERFSEKGKYIYSDIKGIEIRTPIANTISKAVKYLKTDYIQLVKVSKIYGYTPVVVSFNPSLKEFKLKYPLNAWEIADDTSPEQQTEYIHMLTYGPDVSISHPNLSTEEIIDIGKKLTYYSPFIVPFSYSSPFYDNKPWKGLSRRTFYRTGKRPSALVFIADKSQLISSNPTLTSLARQESEIGRIEFKAFDACSNLELYGSLLALIKGLILDDSLKGRALVPNTRMHQKSAISGLHDNDILIQAKKVVAASEKALSAKDRILLEPIKKQLINHQCLADRQLEYYNRNKDIIKTLKELS